MKSTSRIPHRQFTIGSQGLREHAANERIPETRRTHAAYDGSQRQEEHETKERVPRA